MHRNLQQEAFCSEEFTLLRIIARRQIFIQPEFPHHFFSLRVINFHSPIPPPSRKFPLPNSSIKLVASRYETLVLHTFELRAEI
jgi:hypothetical protein